jgi:hypothetical protein
MLSLGEIFYGLFKIVYTIIYDHLCQFVVKFITIEQNSSL